MSEPRTCPDCGRERPASAFNPRWQECFTCRIKSVRISPSAVPTRGSKRALFAAKTEEKRLTEDGDAYKRLRADGFQPKHINGSAELEARATTRFEVESSQVFDDPAKGREALDVFSDCFERDALTPAVTPIEPETAA